MFSVLLTHLCEIYVIKGIQAPLGVQLSSYLIANVIDFTKMAVRIPFVEKSLKLHFLTGFC